MAISVVLRVLMLPRQRVRDGLHGHGGDRAALGKGGGSGSCSALRRHGTDDGGWEDIAAVTGVSISFKVFDTHSKCIS